MAREQYNPVALDVNAIRKRWRKDPTFAVAYDALADEFADLVELVRARRGELRITLAAKPKNRHRAV